MLESGQVVMALNIYRRHGSYCPGGRALHDMTYEADELRRSWKKHSCPIYASGTLNGQFKRKNTERSAWPDAKAVVAEWEIASSGSGPSEPVQPPPTAVPLDDPPTPRLMIVEAIRSHLAIREGAGM
jgi:hypothetical protein